MIIDINDLKPNVIYKIVDNKIQEQSNSTNIQLAAQMALEGLTSDDFRDTQEKPIQESEKLYDK